MFFLVANLVVFRKKSGRFTNFGSGNTYNHLFVLVSFFFRHLQKVWYLYRIRLHVCILFCFLCSFNRTNVFFFYCDFFDTYFFLWFLILFSFWWRRGAGTFEGHGDLSPSNFDRISIFHFLFSLWSFHVWSWRFPSFFFRMSPPTI